MATGTIRLNGIDLSDQVQSVEMPVSSNLDVCENVELSTGYYQATPQIISGTSANIAFRFSFGANGEMIVEQDLLEQGISEQTPHWYSHRIWWGGTKATRPKEWPIWDTPENKAMKLLFRILDKDQIHMYKLQGWFMDEDAMFSRDELVRDKYGIWCVEIQGQCPPTDRTFQRLMLYRYDRERFYDTADMQFGEFKKPTRKQLVKDGVVKAGKG